jgi:hypothetical protein
MTFNKQQFSEINMTFIISNINNENKYKGSYAKIFYILNEDRLFSEVYETEESKGLIGTDYYLMISETPESNLLEKILKLKNVVKL